MLRVLSSYRACAEEGAPPNVGTNCGTGAKATLGMQAVRQGLLRN